MVSTGTALTASAALAAPAGAASERTTSVVPQDSCVRAALPATSTRPATSGASVAPARSPQMKVPLPKRKRAVLAAPVRLRRRRRHRPRQARLGLMEASIQSPIPGLRYWARLSAVWFLGWYNRNFKLARQGGPLGGRWHARGGRRNI